MVMDSGPIPERHFYRKFIYAFGLSTILCHGMYNHGKNKYRAIAITIDS